MAKPATVTSDQVDEAVGLYNDGVSLKEIEALTKTETNPGVNASTLYHHLKERGIHPSRQRKPAVTAAQVAVDQRRIETMLTAIQTSLATLDARLERIESRR